MTVKIPKQPSLAQQSLFTFAAMGSVVLLLAPGLAAGSLVMNNVLLGAAIVLAVGSGFSMAGISRQISHENSLLLLEISQRKQAEEKLRHGRETLQQQQSEMQVLFDLIPAMVVFKDTKDVILRVNKLVADSLGKSIAEIEGKTTLEVFPQEAARLRQEDLEVIQSGRPKLGNVKPFRDAQGQQRWLQTDKVPYCDPDGKVLGLVIMAQDISARMRGEESLRLLQSAVEQSRESILITDAQLDLPGPRIVFVNPAFTHMTGYSAEEVLGKTPRILQGPRTDRAVLSRLRQSLDQGNLFDGEAVNYRKDGSEYDQQWQIAPIRSLAGATTHYVAIMRDISASKRIEAQWLQSQKMETVGRLAGGIAHQFNSIMTAILGYSELLLSELPSASPLCSHAHEIHLAAERAATLTWQLLAYGRKQILNPEILDLNSVLIHLQATLGHLLGRGVEVVQAPGADLKAVRADAGQIEQVILNIAMNAADAMPNGGTLTLETANVTLDEEYVSRVPELKAGEYVRLAISDTGNGLTEATRARAFEPFFSTKGVGEAIGLGLSTCYGIIRQSGGHISLYSESGRGATVKVYLPQVQELPSPSPAPRTGSTDLPTGSETILLVEDDPALREMAATLLRRLGYSVLTAADGFEALRLKQQPEAGHVDLLFTDLVMPHLNGPELAERFQALSPQSKVLFTSAYTENAILHQGLLKSGAPLLQKPFTPSGLAHKIREALGNQQKAI